MKKLHISNFMLLSVCLVLFVLLGAFLYSCV
ncbi:Protein of unknown function [Bacillus mycoides]|nr:Protein of unknown function [Bacillus mycoides]